MEKNQVLNITSFILFAVVAYLSGTSNLIVELNPYSFNQIDLTKSHSIVNLLYNSYQQWQFDPLISGLLNYFDDIYHPTVILIYSLFFFLCGLYYCILDVSKKPFSSLLLTISILFTLLSIWKIDLVLISSITWLPFFIYSVKSYFQSSFKYFILLALYSLLLIVSANQLAIIYIPIVFLFSYIGTNKLKDSFHTIVIFSILLLCGVWICQFDSPNFFDFHTTARVFINDAVAGNSRPVFGADSPIEFQNLSLQRNIFFVPIILTLTLSLLLLALKKFSCKGSSMLSIVSFILVIDTFFPEKLAHILPVETLSRLIPNLFFFSLLPYLFFIVLIFVLLKAIKHNRSYLCFIFLASIIFFNRSDVAKISSLYKQDILYSDFNLFSKINSPSVSVILENEGLDIFNIKNKTRKRFRSISRFESELISNINASEISLTTDKKIKTRWTSGNGTQDGFEKIAFKLNTPIYISAIEISPEQNFTDFPRGLKISYMESCEKLSLNSSYTKLKHYPIWPGSIKFTKLGFPYYSQQSLVKVYFPKTLVQCVLVEQTNKTKSYDWSVNEIRILK